MKKYILLAVLFLPMCASAAIFQSRDAQGNVTFSDIPTTNSTVVNIAPSQTFQAPTPRPNTNTSANMNNTPAAVYTSFQIVVPEQNGTVRDNNGTVNVTVALNPFLKSNNNIAIFLDGKQIGDPQPTIQFILQNVDRGTHTLLAKIVNNKGVVLQQSNQVTFHLHRARITPTGTKSENLLQYLEQKGYSRNEAMQKLASLQIPSTNTVPSPPNFLNSESPEQQVQLPLNSMSPNLNTITTVYNNDPVAQLQRTQAGINFQGETANLNTQGNLPDKEHYPSIMQGQTPDLQTQGSVISTTKPTIITQSPKQIASNGF